MMKTARASLALAALVVGAFGLAGAARAEVVEFHIKAGTGRGVWNTRDTAVAVKVGDTLRLVNDDQVVHRMHTNDDAPCLHGEDIAPGESEDCIVTVAFDPDDALGCWDHNFGFNAKFWVRSTEE